MMTVLKHRSLDARSRNSLKAWTSGNLLRDLRDRDVDALAKEFPTAAPSKLILRISRGPGFRLEASKGSEPVSGLSGAVAYISAETGSDPEGL